MAVIDPARSAEAIEDLLARTGDPRHRMTLENLRDHLRAEITGGPLRHVDRDAQR